MTPKEQYEARKAERQRRREAKETLDMEQSDIGMEEFIDRFVTAIEDIATSLAVIASRQSK